MSKRSSVDCSPRQLGSEKAGTADNDDASASVSRCLQPRICLRAYTGLSCRNVRLATTIPWSERAGGRTSTFGKQSSRVMTTSNQPPARCVDVCQPKLIQHEAEVGGRRARRILKMEVKASKDDYLGIVESELF